MQNLENKDKILKIFSRVRCFNKDQLPRYVDGRLTHVEKHLLEQHLVNCELCSDAVEILQKPKFQTQYQPIGAKVQQFIRNSKYIAPVYEAERYQKNVRIRENFLTYFWSAVGIALVIGFFYMIWYEAEKENTQTPLAAAPVSAPPLQDTTSAVQSNAVNPADTTPFATHTAAGIIASAPTNETADPDKYRYQTAMTYYHDGNLEEAMPRLAQLISDTTSRYRELAHYQLAMCYKFKKQKVRAREMFKELINMNGRMKRRAQLALSKL